MLEQPDDSLKNSLGFFKVSILVLLWTLTIFQGSYLAAKFCGTEQGENVILQGRRCFIISLWILSGPGAEVLVTWFAQVNFSFEKGSS